MGSGFNFFTNAIDVTPTDSGAWVDVNVSSYIPNGNTGVIVKIVNTATTTSYRGEVRKKGSSDDFGLNISAQFARYAFVGVDANRVFQAYIGNAAVKIYLVGYCDSAVEFFTNAVDKTPSTTGNWVDVDASNDIPSDATGVICLLYDATTTTYSGGIRKKGSASEFTYGKIYFNKRFVYQLCGVDQNRVFQAKIENTALKVMLVGYTKSPVTFFTDAVDVSITQTNTWTDINIASYVDTTADGAILFIKNTSASLSYKGDVRKKGSDDDHTSYSNVLYYECRGACCGIDINKTLQGWISNTAVKFFLIGFCKPAAAGQVYEISIDAVSQSLATPAHQTAYNIAKEASIAAQGLTTSETTFNILKDAFVNALADVLVEVVTGVIEIFKEAITAAQGLCQTETAFNISQDALAQALTQTLFELCIAKDAVVKVSTTNAFEVTFTLPLSAIVKADALSIIESTFHISPEATIKVFAEVAIIKPAEVKITRLFLVIGDLAIQIQGN